MKKPLPTRVPMQEPKKPERTVIEDRVHERRIDGSLGGIVSDLLADGIDLDTVSVGSSYDDDTEREYRYVEWITHDTVTQTDAEWAKTCAQYEKDMAFYVKDKALYEASQIEYHQKLAAYKTWLAAKERRTDLETLNALLKRYPDARAT